MHIFAMPLPRNRSGERLSCTHVQCFLELSHLRSYLHHQYQVTETQPTMSQTCNTRAPNLVYVTSSTVGLLAEPPEPRKPMQ